MDLAIETARAKRSCAERGYVEDPFIHHFVSLGEERLFDPSIHRGGCSEEKKMRAEAVVFVGYYARSKAIEFLVRECRV